MSKSPLPIIFVTVFIDLLGFGIIMPLLPRYAERLAASDAEIGLLMASFSAMQFVFAPLWGRVSDRIGRRPVLVIGLAGSAVFYGLFGYATTLVPANPAADPQAARLATALLFVARIGAGISGANITAAQAYIADSTPPDRRAGGMALIGAAFGIGFTFGPLLGSFWVSDTPGGPLSPAAGYLAAGLSAFACLWALFLLPESLKPGATPPQRHILNLRALGTAVADPAVGLPVLTFFLATFAFGNFEGVLARVTTAAFRFSDRDNFYGFALVGLVLALAQGVLVRALVPRLGEIAMSIIGIALMAAGLATVGVAVGRQSALSAADVGNPAVGFAYAVAQPWFWAAAAALAVQVVGFAFLTPSIQALISRRSGAHQQGEILGLNQSAAAMARILGPSLGNLFYSTTPADLVPVHTFPFFFGAAVMLPALLCAAKFAAAGEPAPAAGDAGGSNHPQT